MVEANLNRPTTSSTKPTEQQRAGDRQAERDQFSKFTRGKHKLVFTVDCGTGAHVSGHNVAGATAKEQNIFKFFERVIIRCGVFLLLFQPQKEN